uniref:Lysis protein for colicin n=1 Tax=Klebsiella pneumoniae TaxID=573 RepID=A0A6M6A498_KLEPN|nr:DNA replication protein [Klebsiella pneumoniae]QJX13554.1 DNA replication protein [Klebsiella pneumoniae]
MGSCAAPSAKGDDKFITTDYLQQCQGKYMKKVKAIFLFILIVSGFLIVACQANYIRDVQGGTVAPSSSSELTGIAVQ